MKQILTILSFFIFFNQSAKAEDTVVFNIPEKGTISTKDGLAAWEIIYEIASHPRCSNCHVGADNIPMWSGPSYGTKPQPHGMNINAGDSRIGAEHIPCSTCHTSQNSALEHGAPGVATEWQLAPVEAEWFGKSSPDICKQLRDPDQNGDRSIMEIAEHIDHDEILHWAWDPGKGREPAPHSLQILTDYIFRWGAAGTPCPEG